MTGTRKPAGGRKFDVQRIAVNAQGYDSTGAYWGAGPDVFIVTTAGGADEVTVRAKSAGEARAKATAELARQPGQPRAREPLGGKAPRTTRHEIDWTHPSTGAVIRLRITHARDYLVEGTDHVEVESTKPKRAALPITETGYGSSFIDWRQLKEAGGPVAFIEGWLARETQSKDWKKRDLAARQGDLFQWADAQAEAGAKRDKPKASKPAARKRNRDAGRAPE
jgi:hypothetical protein